MIIVKRESVILRHATDADLPRVDEITIICYAPIAASFVEIVGEDCARGSYGSPDFDWKAQKTKHVRDLYQEHPDQVWVLEEAGQLFGFVTFDIVPGRRVGFFDNNGVLPEKRGQGWGTFMYRHVLRHFREQGIRFVFVETDLDEPHVPARRAYEAIGFDSQQRIVIYRQDLDRHNPGSEFEPADDGHEQSS
jgi:ribosomal protein S18 acetylase RimI-like enzyme